MKPEKIENLFTDEELVIINNSIERSEQEHDKRLGRSLHKDIVSRNISMMPILAKLKDIANKYSDAKLSIKNVAAVEYNLKYGEPNLPPHFDGDVSDMIINFQLSSNTRWHIGLNMDLYDLKDNSALLFNPNKTPHWRPIKKFKEGEFIKMIFFRFINEKNISDYSDVKRQWDHQIFSDINKLRNNVSGYYKS